MNHDYILGNFELTHSFPEKEANLKKSFSMVIYLVAIQIIYTR